MRSVVAKQLARVAASARDLCRLAHEVLIHHGEEQQRAEDHDRVDALAAKLGQPQLLKIHDGSYASFASHIAQSSLYVGYDSAGQHVAAAAGVPLVSIFTGYVSERMFNRWRPATRTSHVVAIDDDNRATALDRTLKAISAAVAAEAWANPTG